MLDKPRRWSKHELDKIWSNYINIDVFKIWKNFFIENFNLNEEAPCPLCGGKMVKGAYQDVQPNSNYCWNVDHIDSNPRNNNINNLQPMHP